jgi:hypothetical protein
MLMVTGSPSACDCVYEEADMTARARFAILTLVALATVSIPARTSTQAREPLAATDVGRLSGEIVIRADGGGVIGRLNASVEFFSSTRTGTVVLHFVPATGGTGLTARAHVSADSPEEGFGAVSALVAAIAGRPTGGSSSVRLSNLRVQGDVSALRAHADRIATWWDAQAEIAVGNYVSPFPIIGQLARLQLNVWGTEVAPHVAPMHGYATLSFDPADPTVIAGGRVLRRNAEGSFSIQELPATFLTGTLTPITDTPAPNDFLLCIGVTSCSTSAVLLIDVLPDGTVDVRGTADSWVIRPGAFTVEGTGNARFVPPGQ